MHNIGKLLLYTFDEKKSQVNEHFLNGKNKLNVSLLGYLGGNRIYIITELCQLFDLITLLLLEESS